MKFIRLFLRKSNLCVLNIIFKEQIMCPGDILNLLALNPVDYMFPAAQEMVNISYLTRRKCFVSVMCREVRCGGQYINETVKAERFGRSPLYCSALQTEIFLLILKKTVVSSSTSISIYIIRTPLILFRKMTLYCVNNSINMWQDGITSVKSDYICMCVYIYMYIYIYIYIRI